MTDPFSYLRVILALLFIACLIVGSGYLARRFGLDRRLAGSKLPRRLHLLETLYLDPKHKLVCVQQGQTEHLLLISASGNLLIHSAPAQKEAVE